MSEGIGKRIDEMYAFVMVHTDGDEGVIGFRGPDGHWLPLVGADMKRVDSLRSFAQVFARKEGKPVRLVRFTTREVMETFVP